MATPKTAPDPRNIERIAIRLTNWVGDCVMNTPFLGRVREMFPNARILCLGRSNVASLLQPHPDVDEVWPIDDKSMRSFRETAARLREWRADLGFLLPNSLKSAALLAAARVPHRVGYNRDARRLLLTMPVELRPEDLAVHEVKYYLRLLHFWEKESRPPPPLKLTITQAERDAMAAWLAAEGITSTTPIVGVNPAAFFGTAKRWLPERFAESARRIASAHGGRVVVTGLPQERDVAQAVCDAGGGGFVNAAGRMKLRELMAFLARADVFLTNDSGAMHIAAALGTPLLAVFGSTDWVTTAPLGDHCRIVRAETPCAPCLLRHCPIDHRCMTGVTSDMATRAAEELLASRRLRVQST